MIKLPKIIWHDELPQWIMTDIAAYHPATKTIHIRKGEGNITLIHELIHWVIDIIGLGYDVQIFYDKLWQDISKDKKK